MKTKKTILKKNTKTIFYNLENGSWIETKLNDNHLGLRWVSLYGGKRIGIIDKEAKKEMFLDWFNNFLSTERFAEYYQINKNTAIRIINEGREYFNLA